MKSTLKNRICIYALDLFDLVPPNFLLLIFFIFGEFSKNSKVTPKQREQRRI